VKQKNNFLSSFVVNYTIMKGAEIRGKQIKQHTLFDLDKDKYPSYNNLF
jgi:hypothetical protein